MAEDNDDDDKATHIRPLDPPRQANIVVIVVVVVVVGVGT